MSKFFCESYTVIYIKFGYQKSDYPDLKKDSSFEKFTILRANDSKNYDEIIMNSNYNN